MVRTFDDHEALSRAAAELFAAEARRAVQAAGTFSVCLSGGQTPRRAYQLLAEKPLRSHIPWHGVQIFFSDERMVPPEDPRSNLRMAREALLDHVPVAAGQIHGIPTQAPPEECALKYETLLAQHFAGRRPRFDLILLGLGSDGHTASLLPGSRAVEERERWVVPAYQEEQKLARITLTFPLLNEGRKIAFLVSGEEKAHILKKVLKGEGEGVEIPARLIAPMRGELLWLVDRDAARLLE